MTHDDEEHVLREERQAIVLRRVADLGAQRAALLRQAEALLQPLSEAVIEAARLGAPRRRTQDLAQVSPPMFYRWLDDAGIPIRTKRDSRRRRSSPQEKP